MDSGFLYMEETVLRLPRTYYFFFKVGAVNGNINQVDQIAHTHSLAKMFWGSACKLCAQCPGYIQITVMTCQFALKTAGGR